MSISVVIPAYNAGQFLKETINAVLNQTLPVEEIIVVDDGSKDDTCDIAESFGPPVTVYRRTNQGPASARNFAAKAAKGEWIALLDADDVWLPNKLERQMEELALHPEADVCYTGHVILQHQGDTVSLGRVCEVPAPDDLWRAMARDVTLFLPSSVLIRRSTWFSVGGFDESLRHGVEDLKMWIVLLRAGVKFAACREPLFQYRRHGANLVLGIEFCNATIKTYRELVLGNLPRSTRWKTFNAYRSEQECEAAYTVRRFGDPRCLRMMALSILHNPFTNPDRYKALAHMSYSVLSGKLSKATARPIVR